MLQKQQWKDPGSLSKTLPNFRLMCMRLAEAEPGQNRRKLKDCEVRESVKGRPGQSSR